MREVHLQRLWHDDRGAGTIFCLFWFALIVGICGLAVDTTDGFRSQAMLQASADSAALAAAIELPDKDAAITTAIDYAEDNMATRDNGQVLKAGDVAFGQWNPENHIFKPESAFATGDTVDAVHVVLRRSSANANPVATNFLRIIGKQDWNVRAQAIAQRFTPDCLTDGLIARGMVDMSSGNGFYNRICIHGQQGVNIRSNNYFELGVNVSMPSLDMLETPASGMGSNTGLPQALREDILDPRMVNHTDEIMAAFLDPGSSYQPSYIDVTKPVIAVDEKFDLGTVEPGRVYHVECKPNKNARIPSNVTIHDVVIIAECEVNIGASATIYSAVIGSRTGGNPGQGNGGGITKANISASAGVQLGLPDNCAEGGGVQLFSNATIHTSSSSTVDGVQLVAAGDIDLGAREQGINGINAQSGGDITLTANNMPGLCTGGAPDLFTVPYYRLVL